MQSYFFFFFFNDTATTEIYTLSLHDALPIFIAAPVVKSGKLNLYLTLRSGFANNIFFVATPGLLTEIKIFNRWSLDRSEEHTSELQSQSNLVCRLLLEKKKKQLSYQHVFSYH